MQLDEDRNFSFEAGKVGASWCWSVTKAGIRGGCRFSHVEDVERRTLMKGGFILEARVDADAAAPEHLSRCEKRGPFQKNRKVRAVAANYPTFVCSI